MFWLSINRLSDIFKFIEFEINILEVNDLLFKILILLINSLYLH